jgi:hypothetical protein
VDLPAIAGDGREVPATAAGVAAAVDGLLAARERLARRPTRDVLAALDELVRRWLEPESQWRRRAEVELAERTGFAPAMLREGLPRLLAPLGGGAIARLLLEELGERGARESLVGPRLVAHVLPGNVPALAAGAICLALAMRAAVLVKPGREERAFAPLFAASMAEVDPELAACVAVRYWPGGSGEIEEAAFARADVVEASGGDEAIAALRPRVRGRFLGRGGRVSFAAIGREIAAERAALAQAVRGIAEDVSIWDQCGCLSPQVVFVESAPGDGVERAAAALAEALADLARRWPPRRVSLDQQAAILRFRNAVEWGLEGETGGRVLAGGDMGWTLTVEREPALRPTCLHRTVRVQPVADLADLPRIAVPLRSWLEGAGLAVGDERFGETTGALVAAGLHRVCRAGEMQRPDLGWKPGGIPRVAAWL